MATMKIRVPKTPRSAFNPDRPMNGRQRSQLEQFHLVRNLGPLSARELAFTESQAGLEILLFTELYISSQ